MAFAPGGSLCPFWEKMVNSPAVTVAGQYVPESSWVRVTRIRLPDLSIRTGTWAGQVESRTRRYTLSHKTAIRWVASLKSGYPFCNCSS